MVALHRDVVYTSVMTNASKVYLALWNVATVLVLAIGGAHAAAVAVGVMFASFWLLGFGLSREGF